MTVQWQAQLTFALRPSSNDWIGADLVALVVNLAVGRAHQLAEFVVQAFLAEIVFFLRHPFLQAEMRFDDEFRHVVLLPYILQQVVS